MTNEERRQVTEAYYQAQKMDFHSWREWYLKSLDDMQYAMYVVDAVEANKDLKAFYTTAKSCRRCIDLLRMIED